MSNSFRIATVCQASKTYDTVEENREAVLELAEQAFTVSPDLVCLPETFTTASHTGHLRHCGESLDGPTVSVLAERARNNRCFVLCPIQTVRGDCQFNSAIILDRSGEIVGVYDKAQPVTSRFDYREMEFGISPGPFPPPVFELDGVKTGVQICFDLGFPESWQALANHGARLVLWPSAYNGGFPLRCFAALHRFYVVSAVRSDHSSMINPLGEILEYTDRFRRVVYRDVHLDFCVSHLDFNFGIPDRLVAAYGDRVEVRSDADSGYFLVASRDPDLQVRDLQEEFGFETAQSYFDRHRRAYSPLRDGSEPPTQVARHGNRPQYDRH